MSQNRTILKRELLVFGGLLLFALVFQAVLFSVGVETGFFYRWTGNYYAGKVTQIGESSFVIRDRAGGEKTILISGRTVMRKGMGTVQDALVLGNEVIVFGPSRDGTIVEAELIRIFKGTDANKAGP